jgi:hypothetical protein
LKLIPTACVPGATALAEWAPDLCPVMPFRLREPIEPTLRLPARAKLLFVRGADPPNCLYERPLICLGATAPPRAKLLPPLCPPLPRWNPPPPPKWEWPPPREPRLWEPPPPREPRPRCCANARLGAQARAIVAMAVKRRFETRGVIISVPSIGRERLRGEIPINRIADLNGAGFHHVSTHLAFEYADFP